MILTGVLGGISQHPPREASQMWTPTPQIEESRGDSGEVGEGAETACAKPRGLSLLEIARMVLELRAQSGWEKKRLST